MGKQAKQKESKSTMTIPKLHSWNKWLAMLHAVQGLLILVLSTSRTFPLNTSYLTLDSLATEASGGPVLALAMRHIGDINIAYLIAGFFFISAIAHASAAWWCRRFYETDLQKGINRIRWFEYSASASLMLVAIGMLSGVADISTLFMIFILSAIMNLLGLAMEVYNQGKSRPNWLAFIIGCIAGIAPWIVLVGYLASANLYSEGTIPTFVYWIYATLFLLFNCFAINMWLQYKRKGKWAQYLYGERTYMVLSLVAKSALAWQVFFGALRP